MFKAALIILLYLACLGYFTISFDFRDGKGRLRHLYLKGWQESDFQEFIMIGGITAALVATVFTFFK